MDRPLIAKLDEVLSQVQLGFPRRTLFWGEMAGEVSSYVAGWMAAKKMDVVLLDGANRFNPYTVSSFARKTWISPEGLLKRIRIARAFTCYQMATLMSEKLFSIFNKEEERPWVIILGPITTFLDEDVPEREARPLFERSLKRIEEMMKEGVPFFFFQNTVSHSPFRPFMKGLRSVMEPRRTYLTRRLFQFSDLVWRIGLDGEEPKIVLEKGFRDTLNPKHLPARSRFGEAGEIRTRNTKVQISKFARSDEPKVNQCQRNAKLTPSPLSSPPQTGERGG